MRSMFRGPSRSGLVRMGQVTTLFEFILAAMDKRLRSTRRMEKKNSTIPDPIARWDFTSGDFTSANRFQLSFLHDSQDNLKQTLALLGISFDVDLSRKCITLTRDLKALHISDLRAALVDMEDLTERFVVIDYAAIIETMVESCSRVLANMAPYLDAEGDGKTLRAYVARIRPQAIKVDTKQTANFRRQTQFRASIPTSSTTPPTILYPDLNTMDKAETDQLIQQFRCASKGQLMRKLVYYCASMTSRAILRCLQTFTRQEDPEDYQWCAEHNASYAAGSLFYVACKSLPASRSFPSGFHCEVISCWLRDALQNWVSWSPETKLEYLRWRDSYGTSTPSLLGVTANAKTSSEFKQVMCVESCFNSSWALGLQLKFLYSRNGNMRRFDISTVPLSIRHRKGSRLPLLNSPVTIMKSQRDVECCDTSNTPICYSSSV
uniref:Uncharacterized protein n=1 Tax=Lotharella globosa TaxID=91324 RepID=A0A7S4DRR1_9EUKA